MVSGKAGAAKKIVLTPSVKENFFGLLKTKLLYLFHSIAQFRTQLKKYPDYIDNRNIQLNLNGLTPDQHRSQAIWAA